MGRNMRCDMECRIRALRHGGGGADGDMGAEARGEISARIRWQVPEEEVSDAAGAVVGRRWASLDVVAGYGGCCLFYSVRVLTSKP